MIMMSSAGQTIPDSCRSFSIPESFKNTVSGISDGFFRSSNKIFSADFFVFDEVFGFGFLNLPWKSDEFGSDEEMLAGYEPGIAPVWAPVIQGWDRISSRPILWDGFSLRHLEWRFLGWKIWIVGSSYALMLLGFKLCVKGFALVAEQL